MTAVHRLTSRVVLVDRDNHFLLFLTKAPDSSGSARWITPGGGVDPGENHPQAAIRELFEETGVAVDDVGESVFAHDFIVEWDAADHATGHAEFYTLDIDRFEPVTTHWTPEEHVDVLAHRWWGVEELVDSGEPFEPAELPAVVRGILARKRTSEGDRIMSSDLLRLIAELEAQQERLRCVKFDHDDAWAIGNRLIALATERNLSVTVDVTIGDQQAFHAARPGTTSENDWWVERKIRSVKHFGDSSFLLGRRHEAAGTDFNEETGLDFSEYVAHGGCFPIKLVTGELVGTVTVSGLPQADDHALVVEVLSELL